MNVLDASQLGLVAHAVIVSVPVGTVAVIVLLVAGVELGLFTVIVGALVLIVNEFTTKVVLGLPTASVTVIVQLLYVQAERVLKVIVLLPTVAAEVVEAQAPP